MGADNPMAISIQLLGIYRIADPDKVWADLADLSIKEYQAGFDAEAQRSHPSSGSFCRVECGKSARNHQWVVNIPRCWVFIGSTPKTPKFRETARGWISWKSHQFDGPKSGLAPSQ